MYISIKSERVDVAPANGYQIFAALTCDPSDIGKALRVQTGEDIRAVLTGLGIEEIKRITGLIEPNERNT